MLLSCYIILVKFEIFWLSKIFGMTYNLEQREYFTQSWCVIDHLNNMVLHAERNIRVPKSSELIDHLNNLFYFPKTKRDYGLPSHTVLAAPNQKSQPTSEIKLIISCVALQTTTMLQLNEIINVSHTCMATKIKTFEHEIQTSMFRWNAEFE